MSSQEQQKLINEIVQAVGKAPDAAAKSALLKVKLAVTEQQKPSPDAKNQRDSNLSLKKLAGLNIVNLWTLLGLLTLFLLIHGRCYNYYDPTQQLYDTLNGQCWLPDYMTLDELRRRPVKCEQCRNLYQAPVEYNMTKELFKEKYADTIVPVLIKNGAAHWKGMKTFSLEFFRDLYDKYPSAYDLHIDDEHIIAYISGLPTLYSILHMSKERQQQPWYLAFSNGDRQVRKELKNFYRTPEFLPDDTEFDRKHWIFMGNTSRGVHVHIDHVKVYTWQGQVRGVKTWIFEPAVECASICHPFNITLHPGDMLNFDSNSWYHSTVVHPGDMSLAIGSEYN